MIKFPCPHCGVKISAEPNYAGFSANCPTCGQDLVVPTNLDTTPVPQPQRTVINSPAGSLPPVPGKKHVVSKSSGVRKVGKFWIILIGVIIVGLLAGPELLKIKRAHSSPSAQRDSNQPNISEKVVPGAVFWKFQFGESYEECVSKMKSLKDSDYFDYLTNSSGRKWMPDANKAIFGYGAKTTLDGNLTNPCSGIFLLFKNDQLAGIEIVFDFKTSSNFTSTQVKDIEKIFGTKATFKESEDELGNVTRNILINGQNIGAIIDDNLSEDFAPEILIFSR